jgi:hypothetical protein
VAAAAAATLAGVLACSQSVNQHPSPATTGQVQIAFPSTAVAVASEKVQVLVFDATVPGTDCLSLLVARESGAETPKAPALLLDTGAVDACALAGGDGALPISYGSRSFLAVAQRGGQDFFTGCAQGDIEADSPPVSITLAEAKIGTHVPPTTCASLSQKCTGGC